MSGLRAITVPPFQELITRTLGLPSSRLTKGWFLSDIAFAHRIWAPPRCGKALFWLAMSGHARAVSLDIAVPPNCMRTMIPLRAFAIGSNVLFAAYGYLDHIYPVMALHVILLPINVARFAQVRRLVAGMRESASDISIDELLPFMKVRPI